MGRQARTLGQLGEPWLRTDLRRDPRDLSPAAAYASRDPRNPRIGNATRDACAELRLRRSGAHGAVGPPHDGTHPPSLESPRTDPRPLRRSPGYPKSALSVRESSRISGDIGIYDSVAVSPAVLEDMRTVGGLLQAGQFHAAHARLE